MKKLLYLFLAVSFVFTACKKEEGCTDSTATNYNTDAEEDDGSCTYDILGAWTATTVVIDTSLTVTINGTVDNTQSGSGTIVGTAVDAETPTGLEFLSNGVVYMTFSYDNEIDTLTYTETGNNLTIIDQGELILLTYTVNKNNFSMTFSDALSFEPIPGLVYDYSMSQTMNFTRNNGFTTNSTSQRKSNTPWFNKAKLINTIKQR